MDNLNLAAVKLYAKASTVPVLALAAWFVVAGPRASRG